MTNPLHEPAMAVREAQVDAIAAKHRLQDACAQLAAARQKAGLTVPHPFEADTDIYA